MRLQQTLLLASLVLPACGDATEGSGTTAGLTTDPALTTSTTDGTESTEDPSGSTSGETTGEPTTGEPTTGEPTTGEPTTEDPTDEPTTEDPTTEDPTTGEPGMGFEGKIYPDIIAVRCGCHVGGSGGLSMPDMQTAYDNLVGAASGDVPGMNRVEPGDPENSYMFHKVSGTQGDVGGAGGQMPLGGPALSDADIMAIEEWILDGAPL